MKIGIVVIGRNEGSRLRPSLESVQRTGDPIVYVDSGSTDGSPSVALSMGVDVLDLDASRPFSAARARNEGLSWLTAHHPDLEIVQYLDGDSRIMEGWMEAAGAALESNPVACCVFGSLHEVEPDMSWFHAFSEIEWYTTPGESNAFGGICAMRIAALKETGGYSESLIAGEEPELSHRLRLAGWRIFSIDHEMALHDAGHLHISGWFRRCRRTGYAYAQLFRMGETLSGSYGMRPSLRVWLWAFLLPIAIAISLILYPWASLPLVMLYPIQSCRIILRIRGQSHTWKSATIYGLLWHVSIFGQWVGQCQYLLNRARALKPWKGRDSEKPLEPVFDKKKGSSSEER